MTAAHKTRLGIATGVAFTALALAIVSDSLGDQRGYYDPLTLAEITFLATSGIIALLALTGLILVWKFRPYIRLIAPALVWWMYMLKIWHGPEVAALHDCDFSVCSSLSFHADGSFYFRQRSQIHGITRFGRVELRGDTLLLIPGASWSPMWSRLSARQVESRSVVRPVGFQFTFSNEFDRSPGF